MLNKRTNLLFDQKTWENLNLLAEQKEVSIADLIRRAIKKAYFLEGEKMAQRKAFTNIVSLRKKTNTKTL